jgi:hypothetical protein
MAHSPTPPEEYWTRLKSKQGEMCVGLTMVTLAGPGEQESGADWTAVELHPLKASAF